jgi:hypothetical protein
MFLEFVHSSVLKSVTSLVVPVTGWTALWPQFSRCLHVHCKHQGGCNWACTHLLPSLILTW